jgi:hypothetical protein
MPRRIFVAFAPKDVYARDWLVAHFAGAHSPYELTGLAAEGPWDAEWKARCRQHIGTCSGMIALVSRHTRAAHGARWQMGCASEAGKPILVVRVHAEDKGRIPPELAGCTVIDWTWSGIEAFLDGRG